VEPSRPVISSRIQSNGNSASLLHDSHDEIDSWARRIVWAPNARIWIDMSVLIEYTLDLAHILGLRERQHQENSGVGRQHSLDGYKRK
jgi:hypothetical protein